MEEDVVAEGFRKTDEIEVQIDVAGTGTASPVGRIMLDGHLVEMESILVGKIRKFLRQKYFRFLTKHLDKDIPKGLLRTTFGAENPAGTSMIRIWVGLSRLSHRRPLP